jgi:chromosome segregation ATPase
MTSSVKDNVIEATISYMNDLQNRYTVLHEKDVEAEKRWAKDQSNEKRHEMQGAQGLVRYKEEEIKSIEDRLRERKKELRTLKKALSEAAEAYNKANKVYDEVMYTPRYERKQRWYIKTSDESCSIYSEWLTHNNVLESLGDKKSRHLEVLDKTIVKRRTIRVSK